MIRDIQRFSQQEYDVLIIGGGINGASVANLASAQKKKVALLEKNDFASGTSSKSTKLVHGGIRYLENFEFGLVRESLRERSIQLKKAPHLVKPLPFVIPIYEEDQRSWWAMNLGVWLYDLLSGTHKIQTHYPLNTDEVQKRIKGIKKEGLVGGIVYYDAQMDDTRLCLENVLMAAKNGAHVANYVEVKSFLKFNGKVIGAKAKDLLFRREFEIKAKRVVCTTGPWANEFLGKERQKMQIRTTKGIHVVYRGQFAKEALLIPTQQDGRIFFIIPWKGNSLIGTTDTDFEQSPDKVSVEESDIDYLFEGAKRIFPKTEFKREDIITSFAGLRPLVSAKGSPSKVSRKHVIHRSPSGIVFVLGGKYTTYRKIANDCLSQCGLRRMSAKKFELYGGGDGVEDDKKTAREYGVPVSCVRYLQEVYGARCIDVLQLVKENPRLKDPLSSRLPVIAAQVVYAIRSEMAQTEEDITDRRLSLTYYDCPKDDYAPIVDELMSKYKF